MATFTKRSGGWLARVRVGGADVAQTFRTKSEAQAWAAVEEAAIRAGKRGEIPDKTFGDLIRRYMRDVVPGKDGERAERIRLERFVEGRPKDGTPPDPLAAVPLGELSRTDVAAWRDRRLAAVSAGSVLREWNTLSHACAIAVRDWRWLRDNPFREATRPSEPPARTRRISQDEIDRLLLAAGYEYDQPPMTATARVGAALLWAIETAMRAGEICALRWDELDLERRTARVAAVQPGARKTKLGRVVPLSTEALRLAAQLRGIDEHLVFGLTAASVDALFRKLKARAMIDGLHFHDTRREALTRLAAKVDVMTLAKISGHRDLRILSSVYYAPDMADVAAKLG